MADDKTKDLGLDMLKSAAVEQQRREASLRTGFYFVGARLEVNTTNTTDMTPVAAEAAIEIARATHAVPAEERTKQAIEITKQVAEHGRAERQITLRHALVCAVVVVLGAFVMVNPQVGVAMVGLAAVLGGVYTLVVFANKPKALPKANDEVALPPTGIDTK